MDYLHLASLQIPGHHSSLIAFIGEDHQIKKFGFYRSVWKIVTNESN